MIYLCQAADDPTAPIKIGCSKDPERRLKQLQGAHWLELRLLATFPGGRATEADLHASLARHRVRGEWFRPHLDVLALVKEPPAIHPDDFSAEWQGPIEQRFIEPPPEPVPDIELRSRWPRCMVHLPDLFFVLTIKRSAMEGRLYAWQRGRPELWA